MQVVIENEICAVNMSYLIKKDGSQQRQVLRNIMYTLCTMHSHDKEFHALYLLQYLTGYDRCLF